MRDEAGRVSDSQAGHGAVHPSAFVSGTQHSGACGHGRGNVIHGPVSSVPNWHRFVPHGSYTGFWHRSDMGSGQSDSDLMVALHLLVVCRI